MASRQPMTPAEFDAACRELERECSWLSATSGKRSPERNAAVGGHPESKHVLGMARDYAAPTVAGLKNASHYAHALGLWFKVHDVGSGEHLHVQGLPPGEVPEWWTAKYGR